MTESSRRFRFLPAPESGSSARRAQYRWWLLAMQASVIVIPLISLLVWRGAIFYGAQPPAARDYLTTYLVLVSLVAVLTSSWTAKFLA